MNFFVIFSDPSRGDTHSIVGTVRNDGKCFGTFPFEYRRPDWLQQIVPSDNAVDSRKRKKRYNYQTDNSPGMKPSSLIIKN